MRLTADEWPREAQLLATLRVALAVAIAQIDDGDLDEARSLLADLLDELEHFFGA